MNANILLIFQIITDVLICMGVLFLLIRFRKFFKPGSIEISEKTIQDFCQLLDESKEAAGKFLEELEKEKDALKDLALSIDEKERRLNDLINKSKPYMDLLSSVNTGSDNAKKAIAFSRETYREVLSLAHKGLNIEQISQQLVLPEGEIDLILNLSRTKNE